VVPDTAALLNDAVGRERAAFAARELALTQRIAALEAAGGRSPAAPDATGAPAGPAAPAPARPADVTDAYIQSVRAPLEAEVARLRGVTEAAATAARRTALETVVKPLAAEGAAGDVAAELAPFVRPSTASGAAADALEVVDKDGRLRYGRAGAMTVAELVAEHFAAKPWLAAAKTREGIALGSTPAAPAAPGSKAALQAQIAELEAAGKFAAAAPLKTQLMQLAAR
jgi:hypothetical protein